MTLETSNYYFTIFNEFLLSISIKLNKYAHPRISSFYYNRTTIPQYSESISFLYPRFTHRNCTKKARYRCSTVAVCSYFYHHPPPLLIIIQWLNIFRVQQFLANDLWAFPLTAQTRKNVQCGDFRRMVGDWKKPQLHSRESQFQLNRQPKKIHPPSLILFSQVQPPTHADGDSQPSPVQ